MYTRFWYMHEWFYYMYERFCFGTSIWAFVHFAHNIEHHEVIVRKNGLHGNEADYWHVSVLPCRWKWQGDRWLSGACHSGWACALRCRWAGNHGGQVGHVSFGHTGSEEHVNNGNLITIVTTVNGTAWQQNIISVDTQWRTTLTEMLCLKDT